jgi:hypothetical protein
MKFSPFTNTALGLLLLFLTSCNTVYQTMVFDSKDLPPPPDYTKKESWAVFAGAYPPLLDEIELAHPALEADIFFIYPTLLTDKKVKDWNANIWDSKIREAVLNRAVKYQASAWISAGNLYVPYYRQAHYRIFNEAYSQAGAPAWEVAYGDVRDAFAHYLKHHNKQRPIIIASHSQGSMHAIRLVKEFFDQKPLQQQLVGAYLIGTKVLPDTFKSIQPMAQPDAIGGFVSWNAYKLNKIPKNYEEWYAGGVTTNPVSWDAQSASLPTDHKGVLYKDLKVYPKSLQVKVIDGLLWTTLPQIPGRFFMSFVKNYHFADINLFWKDIEQNAIRRVRAWHNKCSANAD